MPVPSHRGVSPIVPNLFIPLFGIKGDISLKEEKGMLSVLSSYKAALEASRWKLSPLAVIRNRDGIIEMFGIPEYSEEFDTKFWINYIAETLFPQVIVIVDMKKIPHEQCIPGFLDQLKETWVSLPDPFSAMSYLCVDVVASKMRLYILPVVREDDDTCSYAPSVFDIEVPVSEQAAFVGSLFRKRIGVI